MHLKLFIVLSLMLAYFETGGLACSQRSTESSSAERMQCYDCGTSTEYSVQCAVGDRRTKNGCLLCVKHIPAFGDVHRTCFDSIGAQYLSTLFAECNSELLSVTYTNERSYSFTLNEGVDVSRTCNSVTCTNGETFTVCGCVNDLCNSTPTYRQTLASVIAIIMLCFM